MKFFCFLFISSVLAINANSQTIDIAYDTVCLGKTTSLRVITDLPQNTITQYLWDLNGDQDYSDGTGPSVNYITSASNSINLKIVTTSTTYYKHKDVTIHPSPVALFAMLQGCTGDTVHFIDYSYTTKGTIASYTWYPAGDNTTTLAGKTDIYHIYRNPGTYQPRLLVENSYGCTASYSTPIDIKEKPGLLITKENLCLGDSARFGNEIVLARENIARLTWNFGDGTTINRFTNTIKHLYKNTGTYNVSISAEHINGCINAVKFPVDISSKPSLDLTFNGDTLIYPGAQLSVLVSNSYDSLKWSTGSNQSQITVDRTGLFGVDLFKDGCKAGKTFHITVLSDQEFTAPVLQSNIITPNNDGRNDKLIFRSLNSYPACTLHVYNQKGVKIYMEKNFKNNWDMQANGSLLETGAYYYVLEFESRKFTGNFNILN